MQSPKKLNDYILNIVSSSIFSISLGPSNTIEETSVSEDPNFKTPKPKCRKFIFKPFVRTPEGLEHDESKEPVDVIIPEQLAASYGLYLWPSAPVLGIFRVFFACVYLLKISDILY